MRITTVKKLRAAGVAVILFFGVLAACSSENSEQEVYTLTLTTFLTETASPAVQAQYWVEQVEERSNGRVRINVHYGGSLVPPAENGFAIADGRADLGPVVDVYNPAELPLSSIAVIPFLGDDPEAQIRTLHELASSDGPFLDQYLEMGVRPIFFALISPHAVVSTEPVEELSDFQGTSVRAVGHVAQAFSAAGANPVALQLTEIFEALQRGTVGAASSLTFDLPAVMSLYEVAPYVVNPRLGIPSSSAFSINLSVWESLPDDLQQLMLEVGEETMDRAAAITMEADSAACDTFVAAGVNLSVLDSQVVEDWSNLVGESILNEWRSAARSAGISDGDRDAFFTEYTRLMAHYTGQSTYVNPVDACLARR